MKLSTLFNRCLRGALLVSAMGILPLQAQAAEAKVLNIYNWADYLPAGMKEKFEKETGIQVNYDTFDSNEVLYSKLAVKHTGYDIVVPTSNWAALEIKSGLFQKLDKSKLSNWKNLDPELLKRLAVADPNNQYLVNWAWGYVTIGINLQKVKAALGNMPMPENAWALIFDPKYAKEIHKCGINVLDSASDLFPTVLSYMGRNPFSNDVKDYGDATKVLMSVRPYINRFHSSAYIDDMAQGNICAAIGYSGDFNIANNRAQAAKEKFTIKPLIPKTGAIMMMDSMAIPADAPHPQNALLFMNFIMRPENAAAISNKMFYATMNVPATQYLDKDIKNNDTIVLSAENKKRLIPMELVSQETRRVQTRLFTRFKTGL